MPTYPGVPIPYIMNLETYPVGVMQYVSEVNVLRDIFRKVRVSAKIRWRWLPAFVPDIGFTEYRSEKPVPKSRHLVYKI